MVPPITTLHQSSFLPLHFNMELVYVNKMNGNETDSLNLGEQSMEFFIRVQGGAQAAFLSLNKVPSYTACFAEPVRLAI